MIQYRDSLRPETVIWKKKDHMDKKMSKILKTSRKITR